MIMNPREIPEVINSINQIKIPKVWFKGYNSLEIGIQMNKFVAETNYDNYIITSDDLILYPDAFEIINSMDMNKYPVVTGYCNMFVGSNYCGLCSTPLTLKNGMFPVQEDYNLMTFDEVNAMPQDIFETYFVGFSLTKIPRKLWLEFPFMKYVVYNGPEEKRQFKGVSSDHFISYRLTQAGIKMYTHKNTFCKHLKPENPLTRHGRTLKTGWIVNKLKPTIIWEK